MKRSKTICHTTASGVPLYLKDLYQVENTHVRHISFAHSSTFNESIMLWKKNAKLPDVPFAVGIWYQQSHEVIPIGVVKQVPTGPMSVRDLKKSQASKHMTLAEISSFIINRMSSFDVPTIRFNNSTEDNIARAIMWSLCYPYNRDKLAEMEAKKEEEFKLGESKVKLKQYPDKVNIPEQLIQFQPWLNDWIDNR